MVRREQPEPVSGAQINPGGRVGTAPGLYALLSAKASAHGFPIHGGLDLDSATQFPEHLARFDQWLERGFDGEMAYLRRGCERRSDPRLVFPEARSIFCVAVPYHRKPLGQRAGQVSDKAPGPGHPPGNALQGPRYARYLKGRDYHEAIPERLETLMEEVRSGWGNALRWKICVDTSAILERSWAALAGLGWIGKNTMLIHPKHGSYLFLAEVLLSERLGRGPSPLPDYCGHCTRCLEGCPTGAFAAPRSLDSRRCISYWTLEKRGELDLSAEDRRAVGPWVAGCDICQEVCPFNLKPSREEIPLSASGPDSATDATALADWGSLLAETPEAYRERVRNSALNRVKPEQFRRNLLIAEGNREACTE